jgi:hypothetical protein
MKTKHLHNYRPKPTPEFFGHFQDFVSCYVGPFASEAEVREHHKWCQEQGDGAVLVEIVQSVPEGETTMTPAADKADPRGSEA